MTATSFTVKVAPWRRRFRSTWYVLHVEGIGATYCRRRGDVEQAVRDHLSGALASLEDGFTVCVIDA